MTTRTWALTLTCCLLALTATAQDAARTFRDAVVKHQLYLRNFSVDARVRGHWDTAANTLVMDTPIIHSLAVFTAKSAKVKGDRVEITGDSQTLVRDTATRIALSPDKTEMVIQLDLQGADMNAVLPGLVNLLFYADQAEALAAVPKMYRNVLPMKANDTCCGEPAKSGPGAEACDCADKNVTSCIADTMGMPRGVKPPRVIYQVDPEFSEKNRRHKLSAEVQVGLKVDPSGNPQDVWIIRGSGMGLDAKAGQAVSQYRFAPATCGGNPIPVVLYIDVNFQIF